MFHSRFSAGPGIEPEAPSRARAEKGHIWLPFIVRHSRDTLVTVVTSVLASLFLVPSHPLRVPYRECSVGCYRSHLC